MFGLWKKYKEFEFEWAQIKGKACQLRKYEGNEINLFTMFKCTYLGNADSSLLSWDKINYLNIHIHIVRKLHHSFACKLSYKRDI